MLGLENILILHNDCTDHSPQLLRLLERHGVIAQKRHFPGDTTPAQASAYRIIEKHPLLKQCDWAFCCDVDEYLVITKGDGILPDLLASAEEHCQGISVNWNIHGDGGRLRWDDVFVHQTMRRCALPDARQNNAVKSFVYKPTQFAKLRARAPKGWRGDGKWGEGKNRFIAPNGREFAEFDPDLNPINGTLDAGIFQDRAHLNHYILQSKEQFELKRGRPSASLRHNRYNDWFYDNYNLNDLPSHSIDRYADRFAKVYEKIMAIEGVRRLHHLCCLSFVKEMCVQRGVDPKIDDRFHLHKGEAKRLSEERATSSARGKT